MDCNYVAPDCTRIHLRACKFSRVSMHPDHPSMRVAHRSPPTQKHLPTPMHIVYNLFCSKFVLIKSEDQSCITTV